MKLQCDWCEPAHFLPNEKLLDYFRFGFRPELVKKAPIEVKWEMREPAHWFDPGILIADEEAVLISVIDEVYPDIRLTDRISNYRRRFREVFEGNPNPQPNYRFDTQGD